MAGPETRRRVHRATASGLTSEEDYLAAEAPLELRVGGEPAYVTMRTPGADHELIAGLLIAEGVIEPDETWRVSASENVATLDIDTERFSAAWPERSLYASSACGVCGATTVDALAKNISPLGDSRRIPTTVITGLPDELRRNQPMFAQNGAMHAAGLAQRSGELDVVREDVGRHNAVDKVVGWAAGKGWLPLTDSILIVSGRVSFEIAHKAVAAGVPVVVAVSAPTTLAVDLAERFRLTICGFTRGGGFNVYSHPMRLATDN